jgi:[CysO sulfur-carrier protein]-S-L-cysteine hydrolase
MLAQAQTELPNECCGLLGGRVADGIGRVERRYPLVNEAASPVAFYCLEDKSLFAAFLDMRKAGLDLLALYHSHPTSDPVPSRMDREQNYGPDVMNLIISLKGPEPVVRAWWLTETEAWEAVWSLDSEDGAGP